MKLYLESLRDNLAKAAGAATVGGGGALLALVGGLLAKHFEYFDTFAPPRPRHNFPLPAK
jgi:hypothetical protein